MKQSIIIEKKNNTKTEAKSKDFHSMHNFCNSEILTGEKWIKCEKQLTYIFFCCCLSSIEFEKKTQFRDNNTLKMEQHKLSLFFWILDIKTSIDYFGFFIAFFLEYKNLIIHSLQLYTWNGFDCFNCVDHSANIMFYRQKYSNFDSMKKISAYNTIIYYKQLEIWYEQLSFIITQCLNFPLNFTWMFGVQVFVIVIWMTYMSMRIARNVCKMTFFNRNVLLTQVCYIKVLSRAHIELLQWS